MTFYGAKRLSWRSVERFLLSKMTRLGSDPALGNERPTRLEALEPRTLFSAVNGVELFYNDSAFDGNDAAITVEDFDAIATDKEALTELEQASFENYSSYHKGINGVMIEIDRRPYWAGEITVDDFVFRTAPAGDADGNPFQWELADAPTGFEFLPGPNYSGTAVMTWDDASAVKNGWLQITVLPNSNTQLRQQEVYYFGSAVGETGNTEGSTRVDISDYIGARYNLHSLLAPAPIDDAYDINRDKKVDALDMSLMRNNFTNFQTDLDLITAVINEASGLNAQVLSFSEVFLRWFEHSHIEAGYQVTGYDSQGNKVYDEAINAGATGRLVEGLAAGSTYTFEVTPIVPDGYAPGPTIEPARVTFTTEERLTNGGQGEAWYSVTLPKEALTRGEAGYGGSGSLSVAQQLVQANSPEAAVFNALTGDVIITDYHSQKSQLFTFNNAGAYAVGEKQDIPGFGFVTDPFNNGAINAAADQMLVVLEDTYGFDGTYSDRDYDDWYWKVDAQRIDLADFTVTTDTRSETSNEDDGSADWLWGVLDTPTADVAFDISATLDPQNIPEEHQSLLVWGVWRQDMDVTTAAVAEGTFADDDLSFNLNYGNNGKGFKAYAGIDLDGSGKLDKANETLYRINLGLVGIKDVQVLDANGNAVNNAKWEPYDIDGTSVRFGQRIRTNFIFSGDHRELFFQQDESNNSKLERTGKVAHGTGIPNNGWQTVKTGVANNEIDNSNSTINTTAGTIVFDDYMGLYFNHFNDTDEDGFAADEIRWAKTTLNAVTRVKIGDINGDELVSDSWSWIGAGWVGRKPNGDADSGSNSPTFSS